MTRTDLIKTLAKKVGCTQSDISYILNAFIEIINDALLKKDTIFIRGFCKMKLKVYPSRIYRNIHGGFTKRDSYYKLVFKPCDELQKQIKNMKVDKSDIKIKNVKSLQNELNEYNSENE